jgi:hypothetical protein
VGEKLEELEEFGRHETTTNRDLRLPWERFYGIEEDRIRYVGSGCSD